jgi:hypothetical protein
VSDAGNADELRGIVDVVQDAPVADANAPEVSVRFQLLAFCRSGVLGKRHNLGVQAGENRVVKRVHFSPGRGF